MRRAAWGMVALAALASCTGTTTVSWIDTSNGKAQSALVPLSGCDEAKVAFRQAAIADMNARIDQVWQQYLQYGSCYPPAYDSETGASGGAKQVSGTNNQVAGVDEADFLKNDNEFIYVVANGHLRIIDAWPADESHVVSTTAIEGTPTRLYVTNDRALVYSSLRDGATPAPDYYGQGECTYGYDCQFAGDGYPTKLAVFDIADRAHPALVREIRSSASYVNARRIGTAVHTILASPAAEFPGVVYYPAGIECGSDADPAAVEKALDDLRTANTIIIEKSPLTGWLPTLTDTIYTDGQPSTTGNLLASCPSFYRSSLEDGSSLLTVMSVSIDAPQAPSTTTILSRAGAAYASSEALYLAVPQERNDWYGWYGGWEGVDELSTVHKFALDGAVPTYVASGVVKGRVLNQFSMDEKNGYLRIATTTGHLPSDSVHSTLSVLGVVEDEIATVGQIDGIAPSEDIRSVRFDGTRAFIVTFKKTDPLFVFDLSDPLAPTKMGELKIPGFSTYMHMMDASHLLTIGYDAEDEGDFAWFSGVLVQVFDVTEPANPTRQHAHEIGTRGSSSEALTNHLAFNYFDPLHLLALPMTVCEGGSGGSYGTEMTFNGLMVFDVTVDGGIVEKGRVAHPNSGASGYDNQACSSWWTNASTEVKRSIFMDDWVFSVSERRIKVNRLTSLGTDVTEVSLE